MQLSEQKQAFVLHFGEMGSKWGFSRTVGQIYALLYVTEAPVNADQIVAALSISRGNVSMGLKELQSWRLVRLVHVPGDRKDYFTTPQDNWEILRTIAEERKKREIDPTLSFLRSQMAAHDGKDGDYETARIGQLLEMIELVTSWYDDVSKLETTQLKQLLSLGARVKKILDFKDKVFVIPGGKARKPKER